MVTPVISEPRVSRYGLLVCLLVTISLSVSGCDLFGSDSDESDFGDTVIQVQDQQKLSASSGNFGGSLSDGDLFGASSARLGDIDGDGLLNVAVGAPHDDDGGTNRGAIWILDLRDDGTVAEEQKISDTEGEFRGSLHDGARFGDRFAFLGDMDGDGRPTLAASAISGSVTFVSGTVWMLELNSDGTVNGHTEITEGSGGFDGPLSTTDKFGTGISPLGDIDDDGKINLAVGARHTDDGGEGRGAVWILDINEDGSVADEQKISDELGGFGGTLENRDKFGAGVASLGDLNENGTHELAVGTPRDDDGGADRGALWILSLEDDATVASEQKISSARGGFESSLLNGDRLGTALGAGGDLNSDGVTDLIAGAGRADDGGRNRGVAWILYLNRDGTVAHEQAISQTRGGFGGMLKDKDRFGTSVTSIGDLDGNGVTDFIVGAQKSDDEGIDRGAVWLLFTERVKR